MNTTAKTNSDMLWNELFNDGHEPSVNEIKGFVETPLWDDLSAHLQQTYGVQPKLSYSNCSMDEGMWKGWNVKYKKRGKALCALYPKQGHFLALVNVGAKEAAEADLLMPLCDEYTQELYRRTKSGNYGKSLAFDVTSESILRDMKELIALRAVQR
jgi:AraC family transcriptional regulator